MLKITNLRKCAGAAIRSLGTMAKGQKKSNKEARKPKQAKAKPAAAPLFKSYAPGAGK